MLVVIGWKFYNYYPKQDQNARNSCFIYGIKLFLL